MVTRRIRLGTLVASPNFRHPVPFSKEVITVDDVSGGRLTLGLGAGGEGWDATVLGHAQWSRRERVDRFLEFVDLLDRLLRNPATSYTGKYYSANEARTYPGCVQRPRVPFAVAATAPRGMYLAAKHGLMWVTTGDRTRDHRLDAAAGAKLVREQMKQLEQACTKVERDFGSLRRLVLTGPRLDDGLSSLEAFRETIGLYAAAGVTDFVVHWPRIAEPYAGDVAVFERIISSCISCAPHKE